MRTIAALVLSTTPPRNEPTGPDFLTAKRETLGLVLQPQKAPVDVLVIDHAKKATAN